MRDAAYRINTMTKHLEEAQTDQQVTHVIAVATMTELASISDALEHLAETIAATIAAAMP